MPTLNHIRRIGAAALDLLYPRKCVGCGRRFVRMAVKSSEVRHTEKELA